MTVFVFRTSLKTKNDIKKVTRLLDHQKAIDFWNVDLEDCDNILRLEVKDVIDVQDIIENIKILGYDCEELQ